VPKPFTPSGDAPLAAPATANLGATKYIGQRIIRREDARFLTGRTRYVDDIRLPRTVHAAFVRSTARDFFVTYLTTSLGPGEILREARFPMLSPTSGWGFMELARRHGDYAIVSVATILDVETDGTIGRARIALGSVADRAVRSAEAEAALVGRAGTPALFEAAAAALRLDPPADVHGSSSYRREVAPVLVERSLAEAWARARGGSVRP
jgi:CO/xanthine dehydrogenase FAD-binding subunit